MLNILGGCSQPQADATPSFFPGSMRLLLGLFIDAQSVSKSIWKGGEHLQWCAIEITHQYISSL